ncbi:MAG: BlaI/MecI/CopY family transcriptional regulator [Oscillospiraceae bacterium]|nr:BlaI/MecI/CopY family transcriptional regulator [Oscillospiraceae bacterium]
MSELTMGAIESRFAEIIWQREPVTSPELVKLAAQELDWKKSTTYTVLRRLCERGIFQNNGGTVTSLISKQDFYAVKSEQFVEETFSGSLPAFLAAFTTRKKLSDAEINELQELINQSRR